MGDKQKEIQIIRKPSDDFPFLVINKPSGLPSAPLSQDDVFNAYFQAQELFPELNLVTGRKEIEHGLLHRLDTDTSGLLMIACNQESYDFMMEQQKMEKFAKFYRAQCDCIPENAELLKGFPPVMKGQLPAVNTTIKCTSYFRNFGEGVKEVRPVTENSGKAALKKLGKPKLYTTEITVSKENGSYNALCKITSGYRHQVRCHLAWNGFPVKGDELYNSECKEDSSKFHRLEFMATGLEFINPVTGMVEKIFLK